jgi:hypothetical protein
MKKASERKNVGILEERITVDNTTGEVTVNQTRKFYKIKFDIYARLFKNGLLEVGDELTGNDFRVFHYLLGEIRDGSNIINLGYSNYKELTEGMFRGSSLTSFRRSLRRLIECDVIKRIMQNVYMINPEISHSGSEEDRKEIILEYKGLNTTVSELDGDMFEQERGEYSKLINSSDNE